MKRKQHEVIVVEDIYVSADVSDELFTCDLSSCKGACCVEGDVGAPLEEDELPILEEIYDQVAPYMREVSKKEVKNQGKYVLDSTDEFSTPLVKGRECVYVTFDKNNIALCAIEQAYMDDKIDFRKPVSCHLYPIRIYKGKKVESMHYDRWSICSAACRKGLQTGIKVYEFVKDAIIRKYGAAFYGKLDEIMKARDKEKS